jgi:spore germination protein GerM
MRKLNPGLLMIAIMVTLLIAGCSKSTLPTTDATQPQTPAASSNLPKQMPVPTNSGKDKVGQGMMQIKVYQATKDAMHLAPEMHMVPKNNHPAQTALEMLVAGTTQPGHVSVVPRGTKVIGVTVKNFVAEANFNDKLVKNNHEGSTSELLLVAAIVDTLTEFPNVHRVQIQVNGKPVATLSGHMDTSEPFRRMDNLIIK